MNTDRIETLGLSLLFASLVLFVTLAVVRETTRPAEVSTIDIEASRTASVAIRARAAGRAEHADTLLAALASRSGKSAPSVDAFESGGGVALTGAYAFVAFLGALGAATVWTAARRRRAVFRLLSDELLQPDQADDPQRIICALYRLRAERSHALRQLEKLRAARDLPVASLSASGIHRVEASRSGPYSGAVPPEFPEFGRILEITAIDGESRSQVPVGET